MTSKCIQRHVDKYATFVRFDGICKLHVAEKQVSRHSLGVAKVKNGKFYTPNCVCSLVCVIVIGIINSVKRLS